MHPVAGKHVTVIQMLCKLMISDLLILTQTSIICIKYQYLLQNAMTLLLYNFRHHLKYLWTKGHVPVYHYIIIYIQQNKTIA